ncbi:cytochrome c biogenesis CcdA family protein [Desertimonas flava]|uniref:cytochrome c biogenesis CcdA family protein n=1 Tax=Desertimonas flava TaxID=2064846 RepID=UPI000E34BD75|nr:cytochrome c biogenesis protein CcdA [Desertimonas flava]
MLALQADYGLSFLRGMFATVNPCGFVLLPTYLVYFLGNEAMAGAAGATGGQRASVRRALLVGTAVSAGFMAVFIVVGLVTGTVHEWVVDNSKYVTLVLGGGFVVLGTVILAGYRPRFATPHLSVDLSRRDIRTMFSYGAAYAIASLGCTIVVFLPVIASPRGGFARNVANVVMFSAGMGLVVVALTVSLALANQLMLRAMRRVMQYVDLLAAAFMVLSGLYLVWYFFVVDVQEDSSESITGAMRRWEERVRVRLNDNWQVIAAVLVAVVALAIVYAVRRSPGNRGGRRTDSPEPPAGSEPRSLAGVASAGDDRHLD